MSIQQTHTQDLSKKPLISFIITTYNLPSTLLIECLQSILSLSLSQDDREIILVDDGSDSSVLSELTDIQDQMTYIRQKNQGLSAARNLGLHVAQGTYIQFVDGDDVLIHSAYEHCLDIVRNQDTDIVVFEQTPKFRQMTSFSLKGPLSGCLYLRSHNLHASVCSYLFKKNILHGLQFTTGILHEDEEFTPQLFLHADTIYTTNAKAYFYRKRAGSITNNPSAKNVTKRLADTEAIIYRFQERLDMLPEMERKALNRRIDQLTMDYIYNVARHTHSMSHLNEAIDRLSQRGLYPLAKKNYTMKYQLFRKLIQTKIGRRLLILSTY